MQNSEWLERLQTLAMRFLQLGLGKCIAELEIIGLQGSYRLPQRLAGE